jgi:hypothetical protein
MSSRFRFCPFSCKVPITPSRHHPCPPLILPHKTPPHHQHPSYPNTHDNHRRHQWDPIAGRILALEDLSRDDPRQVADGVEAKDDRPSGFFGSIVGDPCGYEGVRGASADEGYVGEAVTQLLVRGGDEDDHADDADEHREGNEIGALAETVREVDYDVKAECSTGNRQIWMSGPRGKSNLHDEGWDTHDVRVDVTVAHAFDNKW